MVTDASLPLSQNLNIASFSRLFANTTASYKILFFRSLLDELGKSNFKRLTVEIDQLVRGMLIRAWYPRVFHHLNFGSTDRLGKVLNQIKISEDLGLDFGRLKAEISNMELPVEARKLARYVPFRLLTPFFEEQLFRLPDHAKNGMIVDLAADAWNSVSPPLYRFHIGADRDAIEVHPGWAEYLAKHFAIILDWCKWGWVTYLHSFNPNAPALLSKIEVPSHRASLAWQIRFWRAFGSSHELLCPYSGVKLNDGDFELDHFIPWSLIGHDQMWNLVPVSPKANASKGNRLPDPKYLDSVVDIHCRAFQYARQEVALKERKNYEDDHVVGLDLKTTEKIDKKLLLDRYEQVCMPLLMIGENAGFRSGWKY